MTIATVNLKWFQFRKRIIDWQNRQRTDPGTKVDPARERSISILQKRYGFDRDKATSEFDRYYSKARLG